MSKADNHLVIMAGGVGSRFWPMSTPECPKQFIDVFGTGRTFIQMTVDRFKGVVPPENIWVVTSAKYADIVKNQLPDSPFSNSHVYRTSQARILELGSHFLLQGIFPTQGSNLSLRQ